MKKGLISQGQNKYMLKNESNFPSEWDRAWASELIDSTGRGSEDSRGIIPRPTATGQDKSDLN